MTNLILPGMVAMGMSEAGIKFQTGPVTSTIVISNAMPLEILAPRVLGILSSFSRFESYQIFSTDERWVNVLKGEKTARATKIGTSIPDKVRKRRPEVITRSQSG